MANGSSNLPPGWAPDTDVAAVVAEIQKRIDRLKELDDRAMFNSAERWFIYAYLSQLIKTGHS